jgi:hypothetical protein
MGKQGKFHFGKQPGMIVTIVRASTSCRRGHIRAFRDSRYATGAKVDSSYFFSAISRINGLHCAISCPICARNCSSVVLAGHPDGQGGMLPTWSRIRTSPCSAIPCVRNRACRPRARVPRLPADHLPDRVHDRTESNLLREPVSATISNRSPARRNGNWKIASRD